MTYYAEWISYRDAYRVYNPEVPHRTIAYIDKEDLLKLDIEKGDPTIIVVE